MSRPIKIIAGGSFPRSINQIEKDFLLKGLSVLGGNGCAIPIPSEDGVKEVCWIEKEDLINQIDSLIVIGRCQCGDPECHTVQFQHFKSGCSAKIVETTLEDDRTLRINVNRENGFISGLEIVRE